MVQTRQMIPSGAYLDRDCFVFVLLAMTSTYHVIANEAKQSRRGSTREQASGLHHQMLYDLREVGHGQTTSSERRAFAYHHAGAWNNKLSRQRNNISM